jgi:hypothetical protein
MCTEDKDKLAFETALASRNFEIELVWKRSQFFWLMNAAALVGFIAIKPENEAYRMIVVCFGLVSAFSWLLINIGSKWWQEAWETKLKEEEKYLRERFFNDYRPNSKRLFIFPLVRFSVTGVVTAFSFFMLILWLGVGIYLLRDSIQVLEKFEVIIELKEMSIFISTILFCILVGFLAKGKESDANQSGDDNSE